MSKVISLTGVKTTECAAISVALGLSIARQGESVLLLEVGGERAIDLILSVQDRVLFDISDVLAGSCKPIKAVVGGHKSGRGVLHYMPAPISDGYLPNTVRFSMLVSALSKVYGHIIISLTTESVPLLRSVAPAATQNILIVPMNEFALRYTSSLVDVISEGDSAFILTDYAEGQLDILGNLDDIIDTVGVRLCGVIPGGKLKLAQAAYLPKTKQQTAIDRIAGRLMGDNVPLRLK